MRLDVNLERGIEFDLRVLPAGLKAALTAPFDHPNPDHAKKARMGFFVGNIPRRLQSYVIDGETLILPRGATRRVEAILNKSGVDWRVHDRRLRFASRPFELGRRAAPLELRPYQHDFVDAALAGQNCIIRSATGSGKSIAALEFIRRAEQPAVIIVWTNGLLRQWVDVICQSWGWNESAVGQWGGGKKRLGNGILVGTQSAILNDIDRLAPMTGAVVCDEVQRFAARTFRDLIWRFPAYYRLGISADERRKDRLDFMIRDLFGEVALEISREELESKGYLAPVEIEIVPTDFRFPLMEEAPPEARSAVLQHNYKEFEAALEVDPGRNRLAARLAADHVRRGASVFLFCNRVEQARDLARAIAIDESIPCGMMLGGAENRAEFDSAKRRLKSGELRCAIGTSAAYQGEDIPRLSVGIVVTPTGSNRQLLEQQVGRLRRKSVGKVVGRLLYLWDRYVVPSHAENIRRWYGKDVITGSGRGSSRLTA